MAVLSFISPGNMEYLTGLPWNQHHVSIDARIMKPGTDAGLL
jgi:hypothetical protein